jgi:hypothetical protein
MNYYNKLIKYQNKLLGGSRFDNLIQIFNLFFGNSWVLTGSEAIKRYLDHFKITDFNFPVNDIDIYYINKDDLTNRNIGKFTRKQDQTESSMTFINKETNESFDISIIKNYRHYYDIDGIKLDTPQNMLENYEENLEIRNNPSDIIKINALKKIIELINPEDRKKLEVIRENKRRGEPLEDVDRNRLRFTHINVDIPEPGSPVRSYESPKVGRLQFSDL